MPDHIPARVQALAAQINDEPLSWNERADGSIVIVFCNKGKLTFAPDPQSSGVVSRHPLPRPVIEIKPKSRSNRKRQTNGNSNSG